MGSKKETYAQARQRLLSELKVLGWTTSKPDLKEPWAEPPRDWRGRRYRLKFKAQAVYQDEHSMFVETRGLSVEKLIELAEGK